MSVNKNDRTPSGVDYFDNAYKMMESVTKYLLTDFGVTKTYRDLHVFTFKAKMEAEDKEKFKELVEKYHLDTEASYPQYLLDHYRDTMLDIMDDVVREITAGYTMYPNSLYEFNIKREHQSNAIALCYDLKHILQMAIRIFTPNHIEKYIPQIRLIDNEIEYLKRWRKDTNKLKQPCAEKDARIKINADSKVVKEELKQARDHDNMLMEKILAVRSMETQILLDNLANTQFLYNSDNRLVGSSLIVPAIILYEDEECTEIKSLGLD